MKKCRNRLASMLLALVMVFAMAVPALAAETAQTVTVTVTLQTAESSGTITNVSELTNVDPIAEGLTVTVTKSSDTPVYVTDVVDALADQYGAVSGIKWKEVDILGPAPDYAPTGETGQVLQSLTYNRKPYTNVSTTTGDGQHGTYTGTSWEYFIDGNYVDVYMSQQTVTSDTAIVLSYDTSSFSW